MRVTTDWGSIRLKHCWTWRSVFSCRLKSIKTDQTHSTFLHIPGRNPRELRPAFLNYSKFYSKIQNDKQSFYSNSTEINRLGYCALEPMIKKCWGELRSKIRNVEKKRSFKTNQLLQGSQTKEISSLSIIRLLILFRTAYIPFLRNLSIHNTQHSYWSIIFH